MTNADAPRDWNAPSVEALTGPDGDAVHDSAAVRNGEQISNPALQ